MALQENFNRVEYCMTNSEMNKLFKRLGELHDAKNHDYSHGSNPFSNFEEAAITAGTTPDVVFKVMMGIKLARLNALSSRNENPNFESITDTIEDLANYACLYAAWKRTQEKKGLANAV